MAGVVKSASRTLDILALFASSDRAMSLADVVSASGIPKSSAHMLLRTLRERGFLEREEGRFHLDPAMPASARAWVGGPAGLAFRAALPQLDALRAAFDETVVLGALTGRFDVRILAHRTSSQPVRYDASAAAVIPAYCTALGHALLSRAPEAEVRAWLATAELAPLTRRTVTDPAAILARLRRARSLGYGVSFDERVEGASGLAAPVVEPGGRAAAAINVVGPSHRFLPRRAEVARAVLAAARAVEEAAFGAAAAEREVGE